MQIYWWGTKDNMFIFSNHVQIFDDVEISQISILECFSTLILRSSLKRHSLFHITPIKPLWKNKIYLALKLRIHTSHEFLYHSDTAYLPVHSLDNIVGDACLQTQKASTTFLKSICMHLPHMFFLSLQFRSNFFHLSWVRRFFYHSVAIKRMA